MSQRRTKALCLIPRIIPLLSGTQLELILMNWNLTLRKDVYLAEDSLLTKEVLPSVKGSIILREQVSYVNDVTKRRMGTVDKVMLGMSLLILGAILVSGIVYIFGYIFRKRPKK